jgi:hypothetical protein
MAIIVMANAGISQLWLPRFCVMAAGVLLLGTCTACSRTPTVSTYELVRTRAAAETTAQDQGSVEKNLAVIESNNDKLELLLSELRVRVEQAEANLGMCEARLSRTTAKKHSLPAARKASP